LAGFRIYAYLQTSRSSMQRGKTLSITLSEAAILLFLENVE